MLYNINATEGHLDVVNAVVVAHTVVLAVDQTELDAGQIRRNDKFHTKLMPRLVICTCRDTFTRLNQNITSNRVNNLHVEFRCRRIRSTVSICKCLRTRSAPHIGSPEGEGEFGVVTEIFDSGLRHRFVIRVIIRVNKHEIPFRGIAKKRVIGIISHGSESRER